MMRFRAVEDGGRLGTAASTDGRSWHVLFQGDAGFPGQLDDIVRSGNGSFEAANDGTLSQSNIQPGHSVENTSMGEQRMPNLPSTSLPGSSVPYGLGYSCE